MKICCSWDSVGGWGAGYGAVFTAGEEGAGAEAEREIYYTLLSACHSYRVLSQWHASLGTMPTSVTISLVYLLIDWVSFLSHLPILVANTYATISFTSAVSQLASPKEASDRQIVSLLIVCTNEQQNLAISPYGLNIKTLCQCLVRIGCTENSASSRRNPFCSAHQLKESICWGSFNRRQRLGRAARSRAPAAAALPYAIAALPAPAARLHVTPHVHWAPGLLSHTPLFLSSWLPQAVFLPPGMWLSRKSCIESTVTILKACGCGPNPALGHTWIWLELNS